MSGVSQSESGFGTALKTCGTLDQDGNTIGIVNVQWSGFRWVPIGIRVAVFFGLLLMVFFRTPLGFLPGDALGIEWMSSLEHWEVFSIGTWVLALVLYLVYFAGTIVRSKLYRGVPGVEMFFSRYGKVVKTVKPGEFAAIVDPRVAPSTVISRKPMVIDLAVDATQTKENIKISTHGALVFRVVDAFRLFEQGGFDKFLTQLRGVYLSVQQDRVLRYSATQFNRYMIEAATPPAKDHSRPNIDERLDKQGNSPLTPELVMELSDIDEIDMSCFGLEEPAACERHSILPSFRKLGEDFGIEVIDYIPQGNQVVDLDYFATRALPLVQSIQRLRQSADILAQTVRQEVDEEITAQVAFKQRGYLEIQRLANELRSVIDTLKDEKNQKAIIDATIATMSNKVRGVLAEQLARIDALLTRVSAQQINAAGLEKFIDEYDQMLGLLESGLADGTPRVSRVVTSAITSSSVSPSVDIVASILDASQHAAVLEKMKDGSLLLNQKDAERLDEVVRLIRSTASEIAPEDVIQQLRDALSQVRSDNGIDTTRYSPESVSARIARIEHDIAEAERHTVVSA